MLILQYHFIVVFKQAHTRKILVKGRNVLLNFSKIYSWNCYTGLFYALVFYLDRIGVVYLACENDLIRLIKLVELES